jgi:predicted secreted protein
MVDKTKLLGRMLILVLLCIAIPAGMVSAEEKVTTGDNTSGKAELKVGQVLLLRLDIEADPDYSWEILEINELFLKKKGNTIIKMPGENDPKGETKGMATLRFEGISQGETAVKLGYIKPWERGLPPMKLYTLHVKVE